jgi:hypothetical protein
MEIMFLEVKIMFHCILFALCMGVTAILTQKEIPYFIQRDRNGELALVLLFITLFLFVPLEIIYWFLRWIFLSDHQVFYEYFNRMFSQFSVLF